MREKGAACAALFVFASGQATAAETSSAAFV